MIKGVIFDYGGTLDTAGCHWGVMLWRAYQRHQIPVSEQQFREAYVYAERTLGKNPIIKSHDTFRTTLDVKIKLEMDYLREQQMWLCDEQTFNQKHDAVLNDLYEQVVATTAESRKVLQTIQKTLPMVLVSNFYGNINTVLAEFGLSDLFQHVIESAAVGIRKPDSRLFQLGVEALGLKPEEVLVVGDSLEKDIAPAQQIGCKTAWLEGEGWLPRNDNPITEDRTNRGADENAPILSDWIIHTIKDVQTTL